MSCKYQKMCAQKIPSGYMAYLKRKAQNAQFFSLRNFPSLGATRATPGVVNLYQQLTRSQIAASTKDAPNLLRLPF